MNYNKLQSLIGIPWVYKESDCWGIFKRGSSELFGVDVYDLSLPEISDTSKNIEIFEKELNPPTWIKSDKCKAGCAVIFYSSENRPIHIGLAIDDKTVLHSMGATGMSTSSRLDKIKLILKHRFYQKCEFYDYNL